MDSNQAGRAGHWPLREADAHHSVKGAGYLPGAAAMNPFLAFALWFVTVTLALVLWMLRIYGA